MPAGDPFDTTGFGAGDTLVSATIGSGSVTPVSRSIDLKGGFMQVADLTARDAIPGAALARDDPAQFRQEGMLAFVQDKGGGVRAIFQLLGGITNGDWVEVFLSAGGGAPPPGSAAPLVVTNTTGGPLALGELVAINTAGAGGAIEVLRADAADISLLPANVVFVITEPGGIADAASGNASPLGVHQVLFKAGLVIVRGEDVFLADAPDAGSATVTADVPSIPSGGSVHKVGTVINADAYVSGPGPFLVQCLFFPSQRREQI